MNSKVKMIGISLGAVFVIGAAVLAWLLWDAMSARAEAEDELSGALESFRGYNAAPVFPSQKSIDDVKANKTALATWHDSAMALAARGDRKFAAETPAGFKQRLQKETKSLSILPGGVNGKIAKPEFFFGFDNFLGESNAMPKEEDLPRLATQLDTISQVVNIMSEAGALEVTEIKRIDPPKEDPAEQARNRSRAGTRGKGGEKDAKEPSVTSLDYAITFTARPDAFVSVLNALTASERFFVVKNLAFSQSSDKIVDKLNAVRQAAQKAAVQQTGGGHRRRGAAARQQEQAAQEPAKASRLVVDPADDAPIQASFTLTVYDFGRAG